MTHKGFGTVNKAQVSLELSCFFNDLTDVGNLISGSSAFSKSSSSIWKFLVHVLLKPGLENFEQLMSIELVMTSNHLILCSPLLLLPSIFSSIRVFSNDLSLPIRWPKYWSFSISSSNGNSGLISFSTYWLNLFAVQGTLKSLLQYHRSKASVLQWSAFFMVQLSHPYMTTGNTGNTIALTTRTFVSEVMSLLFNTLSRFVMAFLPRSKCLLISCLQSPSAVILETKKIKVSYCFHCFPIYLLWSDGTRCHNLCFLNVEF